MPKSEHKSAILGYVQSSIPDFLDQKVKESRVNHDITCPTVTIYLDDFLFETFQSTESGNLPRNLIKSDKLNAQSELEQYGISAEEVLSMMEEYLTSQDDRTKRVRIKNVRFTISQRDSSRNRICWDKF